MPEEQGAVNDTSGGSPSPAAAIQQSSGDDLIPTVDFPIPAKDEPAVDTSADSVKTDKDVTDAKKDAKGTGDTKQDAKKDDLGEDRLSAHPRFKQLITEKNAQKEQIANLEKQLQELSARQPKTETPLPFEDLGAESPEELLELLDSDPMKVFKNYGEQIRYETRESLKAEFEQMLNEREAKREEAANIKRIEDEYNAYAKENPDFNSMWDSGEIQAYMEEHPGHTAMSAHTVLVRERQIQEAVKEAEKKFANNRAIKQHAQVLGSGPSAGGRAIHQIPAELRDTKKFGGLTSVLAERSLARTSKR
ncbi:MAG: hypothetical protein ABIH23_20595 [bacterium]